MNIIKDIDFRKFKAKQESQSIRPAIDFVEDAYDRIKHGVANVGDKMPWLKTHECFRFREGELSIWAGVNGSGKSLVMGQCALAISSKAPVLIASMEMLGAATVARMLRQYSGKLIPTEDDVEMFIRDTRNIWIYDQVGSVDRDAIIGMVHWGAEEIGIKHVMIDSLVKCGVDQERNEPQKRFVDDLCWAAKNHMIHIHLVNHMRKPSDSHKPKVPDRFSIKGAGEITDLADNVIIVSRNVERDAKLMDDLLCDSIEPDEPDGYIYFAKQRHGEWEGLMKFWFHEESLQWLETYHSPPMRLI